AIVGKLFEQDLVDPAVRHDLGSVARRDRQDHVEGSQLSIVATAQVAEAAAEALMGVAMGYTVMRHAKLLRTPPERELAARDLRLRHGGDPQQLPDVIEVRHQVVVAELHPQLVVPVADHWPGWLEGERMVDRRRAPNQLADRDSGRGRGDLYPEDLG